MTRSIVVVLATLLLAGLGGCERQRDDLSGSGMLSDSAPPAEREGKAGSDKPLPFPEESVPGGGRAGEMDLDTVARPAAPALPESPTPIPAEQRPGTGR
jgi:hypothetical protein